MSAAFLLPLAAEDLDAVAPSVGHLRELALSTLAALWNMGCLYALLGAFDFVLPRDLPSETSLICAYLITALVVSCLLLGLVSGSRGISSCTSPNVMHLAALWTMTLFCAIAPWIVLEKVILPPHTPLVLRTAGQVWLGAGEALIIWLARKQVKGGKIALPEDDEKSLGRRDS